MSSFIDDHPIIGIIGVAIFIIIIIGMFILGLLGTLYPPEQPTLHVPWNSDLKAYVITFKKGNEKSIIVRSVETNTNTEEVLKFQPTPKVDNFVRRRFNRQ